EAAPGARSRRGPHPVAHPANGEDELRPELPAKPVDVHLDRIALDFLAPAVETFLDLRPREDHSRPLEQQLQQRELQRREGHLDAVLRHAMRGGIQQHELEGLGAQHPRGSLRVVHPVDDEALALQARADGLADQHVVFHQQQPHLRSMINRADERARSLGLSAVELSAAERLVEDAASLGVRLTDADAGRLLALLEELARWNRSYNLTGIRTLGAMVTHHLLDSLAIHPDLEGTRIA